MAPSETTRSPTRLLVEVRRAGIALELERAATTGTALILVDARGENQIVVAAGANAHVTPRAVPGAVLCQLEVADAVVLEAARSASFFALNAAPARAIDVEPDLLVVNAFEYEVVSKGELVAVTYGAEGAALFRGGREIARATPRHVEALDATAAGDAFMACMVVSLLDGRAPEEALRRACAAGAVAVSRLGAQPSLPTSAEVDAILAR